MKRSKRFLSLLIAVMLILTTVVSATMVSTSAAAIENSALVSDYYATNPNGQVGKQAAITIDGDFSDWSMDMLIAKGAAWDVANHYKGAHENCLLDTTGLFAAWDSQNLYVAWQMVNTTDTWHREGDGSLSDGGRVLDVPLILALRVDPNKTAMSNRNDASGPIWGQKMGLTFDTQVDHLLYMSGKPGLGEPALFTAVDASGNTNYTTGCKLFKSAGIEYKMAEGNIMDSIMGLDYSDDPADVTNPDANWVDYKTFKGSMGTHNTKYDSFYEIKIPLSVLGIDESYLTTYGIGAMVVATRGESALDCVPFDTTMLDNVMDDYGADPSTSHEKDDDDVITVDLARIGKGGGNTPPVTQPVVTQPATTTAAPTQPATTSPVVQPTTAEPTEVPTVSTPADIEKPTDPVVIPPVVEPTETTATTPTTNVAIPTTIPVPTLDFGDDTNPTETTKATEEPSKPVIVPTAGILGDADKDGKVSIKDATLIQKHIAKITTLDAEAKLLADVDANEIINIRDVTFIQKWLAKIDVEFEIGEPVMGEEIVIPVPTATQAATTKVPVIIPATTTAPVVEPTTAEPTQAPTTIATVPTTEEPVVTEPVITEPVITEPVITEPIVTEPIVTEPIITEPVTQPNDGTETIYFVDGTPQGWIKDAGARIYLYDYEGMQSYEGTTSDSTTWTFQVPTGLSTINFYRCEGEFTQTAWNSWTMCVTPRGSENTYTATGNEEGSWTGNSNGGYNPPVDNPPVDNPPVDNPPADGDYIYFTDNQGWGTVYCHTWNMDGGTTVWPGTQMENVGGNQYRVMVDSTHTMVKFNGGDGGPESGEFDLTVGNSYSN